MIHEGKCFILSLIFVFSIIQSNAMETTEESKSESIEQDKSAAIPNLFINPSIDTIQSIENTTENSASNDDTIPEDLLLANSVNTEERNQTEKIYKIYPKHNFTFGGALQKVVCFCKNKISEPKKTSLEDLPLDILKQILRPVIISSQNMYQIDSYFLLSKKFLQVRPRMQNLIETKKSYIWDDAKNEIHRLLKGVEYENVFYNINNQADLSLLLLALASTTDKEKQRTIYKQEELSSTERFELSKILLASGANPNFHQNGISVLMHAAETGQGGIISALIHYGANVNSTDIQGRKASDFTDLKKINLKNLDLDMRFSYLKIYKYLKDHEKKSS